MDILSVIIPFFALVLIGYLAARWHALPLAAVPGLNTYVLYFALSAMLFQLGARTPVVDLLDPTLIGLWVLSGLLVLSLAVASGLRQRLGWLDASFGGLIAVMSNSGFMGVPLITALLGTRAAGPIITTLLVDVVLMQSIAIALAHRGHAAAGPDGRAGQGGRALRRVATNPMPWAIVLGAAWGASGLTMVRPLEEVVTMLAASATPVALFTIGTVLARERMTAAQQGRRPATWTSPDVYWLTSLKLLLHPAAVGLLGWLAIRAGLPLSGAALGVLVLTAALPSAANTSMLAERFGADNGRIASVILVSTVLGFGTFSLAASLV